MKLTCCKAYCLFTSGSTGSPKGCVWEHKTLSTSAVCNSKALAISKSSRVLQFAAFMWDISVLEIMTPLITGGCLCIPTEDERMSSILGFMNHTNVNWACFTPSLARSLRLEDADSLDTLCLAGEVIGQDNIERYKSRFRLLSGYGPTECCMIAAVADFSLDSQQRSGNIGSGTGVRLRVVDSNDPNRLVPLGTVGEIVMEGPCVARGYLEDEELTTAAFRTNLEWAQHLGDQPRRLYCSGDLGKENSDGTVTFLGRRDDQVKVRGQRLELGEVEHYLVQWPTVQHAIALLPSSSQYAGRLTAILELKSVNASSEAAELDGTSNSSRVDQSNVTQSGMLKQIERFLGTRLPPFGVPSIWLIMEQMPLTTAKKLDRTRINQWALDELERSPYTLFDSAEGVISYTPSTRIERSLQQAWSEVLQIPASRISLQRSFYDLNGDSIHAIKLVSIMRARKLSLSVTDIFRNPVLQDMARTIYALSDSPTQPHPFACLPASCETLALRRQAAERCAINKEDIEDIYPATSYQEGAMASSLANSGTGVSQFVFELASNVDKTKLYASWSTVIQRHHVLRTRLIYLPTMGTFQVVVRGHSPHLESDNLLEYLRIDRLKCIQLGDSLARLAFVDSSYGVFTVHRAAYDASSLRMVIEDVLTVYHGEIPKERPHFSSFVQYQLDHKTARAEDFWRLRKGSLDFDDFPSPPKSYRPCANSTTSFALHFSASQMEEFTMATVARATWALVLESYTDCDHLIFGSNFDGRDSPVRGIASVPGPTMSIAPIRLFVNSKASLRAFLEQVQNESMDVVEHGCLCTQRTNGLGGKERLICRFRTMVWIQSQFDTGSDLMSLSTTISSDPTDHTDHLREYPLFMVFTKNDGGATVSVTFDSDVISGDQVQDIATNYKRIFMRLLHDRDGAEVHQVLGLAASHHVNQEQSSHPTSQNGSIHHLQKPTSGIDTLKLLDPNRGWFRKVCIDVLNVDETELDQNGSLLELGGDSVDAMHIASLAQTMGADVTVPTLVQSGSLATLAENVSLTGNASPGLSLGNVMRCDLSPAQQLLANTEGSTAECHTGIILEADITIDLQRLQTAIFNVVSCHPMLRARWTTSRDGQRQQEVVPPSTSDFYLHTASLSSLNEARPVIEETRSCVDLQHGPLLAAALINAGNAQYLFLTAHESTVDQSSWRFLVSDLEDCLAGKSPSVYDLQTHKDWIAAQWPKSDSSQVHNAQTHQMKLRNSRLNLPSRRTSPPAQQSFSMARKYRELLDGVANRAFKTQPVELVVAGLWLAFARTVPDAAALFVHVFEDGRQTLPISNLTKTVGCLTTNLFVVLPLSQATSMPEAVVRVKEARRAAIRERRNSLVQHDAEGEAIVEIALHYAVGPLAVADQAGLLREVKEDAYPILRPHAKRLARFDFSAAVRGEDMNIAVSYDQHDGEGEFIGQLMTQLEWALGDMVHKLKDHEVHFTLDDFPLLRANAIEMQALNRQIAPLLGTSGPSVVEDVYSCGPAQEGMLLSQVRTPRLYSVRWVLRLWHADPKSSLDVDALADAWQAVVDRHPILRTIFIRSPVKQSVIQQCVLRRSSVEVFKLQCDSEEAALQLLAAYPAMTPSGGQPPHRLVFCSIPSGEVYCRMEISHAIADGATCTLLWRDLCLAYGGRLPTATQAVPFSRFTAYLSSRSQALVDGYWIDYLNAIEQCLMPSGSDAVGRGDAPDSLDLSNAVDIRIIQRFCKRHSLTVANLLHTCWALVLSAYTGRKAVSFGYMHSGRDIDLDGVHEIAGPLLTLLICRIDLAQTESFLSLASRIQADNLQSQAFQHFSLNRVTREATGSDAELFNTLVSVQARADLPNGADGDVHVEHVKVEDFSEWALFLSAFYGDGHVRLELRSRRSRMSTNHVRRIADTFITILKNAISSPNEMHRSLPIASVRDERQIMAWNREPVGVRDQNLTCVHTMIEHQAQGFPGLPAINAWDLILTYGELNSLASRLAQYLRKHGVKRDVLVPFCFEKTGWVVVAHLAILKAGGCLVPLNPLDSTERRHSLVRACEATLVLASAGKGAQLSDPAIKVVVVDQQLLDSLESPDESLDIVAPFDSLAYVLFTSGSSGTPKGVMVDHRAFSAGCTILAKKLNFRMGLRVLQFAAYIWDVSLTETLNCLAFGGCVCIPSENVRLYDLSKFINAMHVQWALLTPSVARTLDPVQLPSLESLTLVGEAVGEDNVLRWRPHVQLFVLYGLTESTSHSSIYDISSASISSKNIGCGAGTHIWLADPHNPERLAPIGGTGEMIVEGPQLARAYLNDEQLSRLTFLTAPKWSKAGPGEQTRRYVRTGDLASYNIDGTLLFVGRKDDQVKVRGQRIELGDVESHLVQCDKVSHVVAAVPAAGPYKGQLVVVMVLHKRKGIKQKPSILKLTDDTPAGQLSDHLLELEKIAKERLPPHGLPTVWIVVEELPRTMSGKIHRRAVRDWLHRFDRRELEEIAPSGEQSLPDNSRPTNETQAKIQAIWAKVLGVTPSQIHLNKSFLKMGGDSILTIHLLSSLREAQIMVEAQELLRGMTVTDLAERLTTASEDSPHQDTYASFSLLPGNVGRASLLSTLAESCGVRIADIEDAYPATPSQEIMLYDTAGSPRLWTMQGTVDLPAGTDIDRLRMAWKAVHDANPILRTRVVRVDGMSAQQVVLRDGFQWTELLGSEIDRSLARQEKDQQRFGGPLISFIVSRREMCMTIHHGVYDFWSLPFIMRDARQAYEIGHTTERPPFHGFVKFLQGLDVEASRRYWEVRLKNCPQTTFPPLPRPGYRPDTDKYVSFPLRFRRNPRSNATKGTILTAAWGLTLSAFANAKSDVVFGVVLAGRLIPVPNINDIIGPVVTLLPMRITWDQLGPADSLLEKLQDDASDMGVHEHFGLMRIARLLGQDGANAVGAVTTYLIIYPPTEELDGTSTEILEKMSVDPDLPVCAAIFIQASFDDDGAKMRVYFDSNVLDRTAFDEIMGFFESACTRLATGDPQMPVDELIRLCWQDKQSFVGKSLPSVLR